MHLTFVLFYWGIGLIWDHAGFRLNLYWVEYGQYVTRREKYIWWN